jgi:acetyl esterase/lipase
MIRLATALCLLSVLSQAAEPITLPLWPEGVPEKDGFKPEPEEDVKKDDGIRRVSHVSQPSFTVYKAAKPNGTAILICPGGGYNILAIEHEGTQVADYLNTLGITGIVLKYRVPRRDPQKPHEAPLQDAQRAMGIIRLKAGEWGIKPDRIGILGFSAGGNLCVLTALHANERTYKPDPAVDQDARPNFMVPVYPAYLVEEKNDYALRPEVKVTADAPPAFIIHAGDDRLSASASALLYLEYKKQKIPAELHIYSQGGHGFGMKPAGQPVNEWHLRLGEWLRSQKWLD